MNFPGWQCSVHIVTYPVFTDLTDLQKIETEFNYLIRLYEQQSPNHELSLALAHPVKKKKKSPKACKICRKKKSLHNELYLFKINMI